MTFALALTSRESIWVCADRRLSGAKGPIRDDAIKVLSSETADGVFLLTYAGLGETAIGKIEPSEWLNKALRGLPLSVEWAIDRIASVMRQELPTQLRRYPPRFPREHVFVCPAFVGGKPKAYSMGIALSAKGELTSYTHRNEFDLPGRPATRLMMAGSGAIVAQRDMSWLRPLLSLVAAHDRGRISCLAMAARLAALMMSVHLQDASVGPSTTVLWRYRKEGRFEGGGGYQWFENGAPVRQPGAAPSLARGRDIREFVETIVPFMRFDRPPTPEEVKAMEAALNALPTHPDPKLR